eukprot:TRINITY_DN9186_c0_g2_i1.p1 TRINITY_DN9186_c0_g2~~TRINITY_DN9186_c0_g2_i1.p1  ORF type:complete len:363 (+),score=62.17 TRINITY_DN9186_c0_g2_i1:69-1157(+)
MKSAKPGDDPFAGGAPSRPDWLQGDAATLLGQSSEIPDWQKQLGAEIIAKRGLHINTLETKWTQKLKQIQDNTAPPEDGILIFSVDSFTTDLFGGNPAGVCLLKKPLDDNMMLRIAQEMNYSETAFVAMYKQEFTDDGRKFPLRWFTPKSEIDLCGHATLAAAYVLYSEQHLSAHKIQFETKSGILTVSDYEGMLEMDFPAADPNKIELENLPEVLACLGNGTIHESNVIDIMHDKNLSYLMIVLDSAELLTKIVPNSKNFLAIDFPQNPTMAVIVTAQHQNKEYDFVSRFFAPWLGIEEDPVTGSSHCILAPYWARILGKNTTRAYQASARGGSMDCKFVKDRVKIRGNAVCVSSGILTLP